MKKNIIITVLFLLAFLFIGIFLYVYKSHRDIASEEGSYLTMASAIFAEFQSNETKANTKYLDKTIIVSGKISNVDFKTKSMVINDKLFAVFVDKIPETVKPNAEIKIKGRVIGYDSLLEELKLDQCSIVN
jgi:hypothetical protein